MADAVIKKTYAASEAFFQDQNDQNQEFVDRINERQEEADCVSTNTASKVVKRDASGNFAAGTITASLTGNATTATSATTATHLASGALGSIPYQSAANATAFVAKPADGDWAVRFASGVPSWVAIAAGHTQNTDTGTSSPTFTATTFVGALTGNVTGNCSGSSGSCTGNAATATTATTATDADDAALLDGKHWVEVASGNRVIAGTTGAIINLEPYQQHNYYLWSVYNSSTTVTLTDGYDPALSYAQIRRSADPPNPNDQLYIYNRDATQTTFAYKVYAWKS